MIKNKEINENDILYIKENYKVKSYKQIADHLDLSYGCVVYNVKKLGLNKQHHKEWDLEEINYLKNNYLYLSVKEISKQLNRTEALVNRKLSDLKLYKDKSWQKWEIDFLKDNHKVLSYAEIGKHLGRTEGSIDAKCFDLNLTKKEKPWSNEEKLFLKNNYMEIPIADSSAYLGRSYNAIKLQASRMGLKKNPYHCNYNFFDFIKNEKQAYWLGFLTADGWISKNEKNNAGVTGIELQHKDINHLRKFNKDIQGNYRITDRWRSCQLSDNKKKDHHCVIRIYSLIMYESLSRLGFTNNKSFDSKIPRMDDNLIRHFIRGFFDGNGCLCFTNKSFNIYFCTASKSMNEDICDILGKNGIEILENTKISEYGTKIYYPSIYKHDDKIKFLDYIYKDSTVHLDRKYKKYLKVKEKYCQNECLAI